MNKIKIFSMFFLLVEVFYPVQSSYNVQMVFYPPDGLSNPVYLQNAPSGVLADGSVYGTGSYPTKPLVIICYAPTLLNTFSTDEYNLGSIASAYNQNSQLVGTQYQGPCNVLLIVSWTHVNYSLDSRVFFGLTNRKVPGNSVSIGYPPNDLYYETYDSSPLVATSVANAFSGWSQNPAGYTQTWIQVVVGYGTSTAIYIVDKMYNEVLLPDEIVVIDPQAEPTSLTTTLSDTSPAFAANGHVAVIYTIPLVTIPPVQLPNLPPVTVQLTYTNTPGAINMNVKRKVSLSGTPLNALRFFYLMVTAGYKYKGVSCANEPDALNNGGSCYYSTPCIAYPFDYSNIQGYIYNSGSSC